MIRQAISCDICGAEKKQTNHWYVTCEQAGELRVGGWNSRMRQRPNAKHLCGQICLHKLVDEFIARSSGQRHATESVESPVPRVDADASLTSAAAYEEEAESSARMVTTPTPTTCDNDFESSACLIPTPPTSVPRPAAAASSATVVSMPQRLLPEPAVPKPVAAQIDETPNYSPRRWRAEAWERERNRELRTELPRRHKSH